MRLTRKLILALTLVTVIVLGVHALLRVRREVELFEDDTLRDDAFMARVLARAVKDAWRAGGEPAAAAIFRDTELTGHTVRVRWVWLDRVDPHVPAALREDARRHKLGATRVAGPNGDDLVTLVAIQVPDGRLGGLELVEPLAAQRRYIRTTVRDTVVSTAILIATLSAASLLVGLIFIGGPTRALVAKARRVAGGDLSGPLAITQRDELGQLAAEINAMCDQLAGARDRATAETEARIATVEQLRHADRLTTVGRLAAGVAHELGTPLNVVAGRAQMIAAGELAGDEIATSARIIDEQAKRMTAIVRQLLDFARARPARREVVALRTLTTRTLAIVETIARTKGVQVTLVDGAAVDATADDGPLQQALLNLLVNAIQATAPGGVVTISIDETEATPPAGSPGARGRWARLTVDDKGIGIAAADLPRVFEPFFTTKGIGEGTGLGLAVTYGIVRDAGGWIDVVSEPGRGSVFSVYLPVHVPPGAISA